MGGKVRFALANGSKWRFGLVDAVPDDNGDRWYYLSGEVGFDHTNLEDTRRAFLITAVMNWVRHPGTRI